MKFIDFLRQMNIGHKINDNKFIVFSYLDLSDNKITMLPDNLTVGGSLYLGESSITRLPDNLSVGISLYLRDTNITDIPENIICKSIYLDPQKIKNISYRDNCGQYRRTIFALRNRGEYKISAGCFFDNLGVFEKAVDEMYTGKEAKEYKQAARDCITELKSKLGDNS